jgi:hypothetical protein
MATLIITITTIILTLALALVAVYYGGPALTKAHDNAVAAAYITGAQQIRGAVRLYSVEHTGAKPESLDDLVAGNYLRTNLNGSWHLHGDFVWSTSATADQCKTVNEKLGVPDVISCSDDTYANEPVCCTKDDS